MSLRIRIDGIIRDDMVEPRLRSANIIENRRKEPTVNLAIGPSCPVRCEGCYNHFGNTALRGRLVTATELIDFTAAARDVGVTQATISGGDPLFHPEIVPILAGVKGLGMKVKLDTVGTSFLGDVPIVYKGQGVSPQVEINDVAPHVDQVSLTLDGARQITIVNFRKGRADLLSETRTVARRLRDAGVPFGYNTVANATNLSELSAIRNIAEEDGAVELQVFEFDPHGPNPTSKRRELQLAEGEFDQATNGLVSTNGKLRVVCKSLQSRSGTYFLIDDVGIAWKPEENGNRRVIGHITSDREKVLNALREHIQGLEFLFKIEKPNGT